MLDESLYDPWSHFIEKVDEAEEIEDDFAITWLLLKSTQFILKTLTPPTEINEPIFPVWPPTVAWSPLVTIVVNIGKGLMLVPLFDGDWMRQMARLGWLVSTGSGSVLWRVQPL